jgi:predicted nucleic acid-binding Zn ribbon protein
MTKGKTPTRKLSPSQIVFYILCALIVISMVLASFASY